MRGSAVVVMRVTMTVSMVVVVIVIHYTSIVPFLSARGFGSQCGMQRRFLVCLGVFGIVFAGPASLFGQAADETAPPVRKVR